MSGALISETGSKFWTSLLVAGVSLVVDMRIRKFSPFKIALVTVVLVLIASGTNAYFVFHFDSFGAGALAFTIMSAPYGFLLITGFATSSAGVGWLVAVAALITGLVGFHAYWDSVVVDRRQLSGLAYISVPIVQSLFTLSVSVVAEVVEAYHAKRRLA